jgi:hypothetical protein
MQTLCHSDWRSIGHIIRNSTERSIEQRSIEHSIAIVGNGLISAHPETPVFVVPGSIGDPERRSAEGKGKRRTV